MSAISTDGLGKVSSATTTSAASSARAANWGSTKSATGSLPSNTSPLMDPPARPVRIPPAS